MTSRGFTLLELIVVMALVSLIAAIGMPLMLKDTGRASAKVAAYEVAAALRRARGEAIAANAERTLTIDVEGRRFQVAGSAVESLPAGPTIALYTARSEQLSDTVGRIRFFPDGSTTGGEVSVRSERTKYQVQVDWLTGRVSLFASDVQD